MRTYINIKNYFLGVHRWKDALDEVDFLKNEHFHTFRVNTTIEVFDSDREIEFIMVKKRLQAFLDSFKPNEIRDLSCESIALLVIKFLREEYGGKRRYIVKVYEDEEIGGGIVDTE